MGWPHDVVAKVLDNNKWVCSPVTLISNTLEKGMKPHIPPLWIKLYPCCSSARITLALNSPPSFICQWTKNSNLRVAVAYWPSRQSEILSTRRTYENKQNQSRGWTEMCGCYEIIYADTHVRYKRSESQSWVSFCLQLREGRRVAGRPSGAASHRAAHSGPPEQQKWGLEDNTGE